MAESAIAAKTIDVLDVDPEDFQERVAEDAAVIKEELAAGTFDNPQGIVGLEYEFYAVADRKGAARWATDEDAARGTLMRVPRRLLTLIGFEKELGLHNAEMRTSPQPMNPAGIRAQEEEVRARLSAALDSMSAEGLRLVSDAIWTIPPPGETAREYLTDNIVDDGVRIATNMSESARYHAMANTTVPAGMKIDAPHVSFTADTVMPESLITSIQPHYQVPHAADLPTYFRYAIRIAGPLLALGANSPFFPPDLYDADADPADIVADAWMEHRISVFESVLNAEGVDKVRFPRDFDSIEAAVDRIVDDPVFVPMTVDRGQRFDDRFAHFRMKHGTYWRWIRPVFDGETRSTANARIEFRPIPGQPTVRDSIAFQAAFAGLLEHMHSRDHALRDLEWEAARENFYAAVRKGLDADFRWITADGDETNDHDQLYDDLFDAAAEGLRSRGLDDEAVGRYLGPLRERVRSGVTPARWKHREVRRRLGSNGDLETAITGMQCKYIDNQSETLLEGSFAEWSDV